MEQAVRRLGVAVKIMGAGGLPSHDGRRAASRPHLSVSLLMLRDVLRYLGERLIGCYRLSDTLAPYLTHPNLPQFHRQIDECAALLAELGADARRHGIRLTLHAGMHVAPWSEDAEVAARGVGEVVALAELLSALGAGREGVIVLHMGAAGGAAIERCARWVERLPLAARARAVFELSDSGATLHDALSLHRLARVPIVFDTLHFQLNNPDRLALGEALGLALATWPPGMRPKIHASTQRTEAHLRAARGGAGAHVVAPRLGQHADYLNPFEFIALLAAARGLPPFDIMLEAKAADLALLRLRADLARFAPEYAAGVA